MIDRHGVLVRHGDVCYLHCGGPRFCAFIVFESYGELFFVYRHELDKSIWRMAPLDTLDSGLVSVRFNIAELIDEWEHKGSKFTTPWADRWRKIQYVMG